MSVKYQKKSHNRALSRASEMPSQSNSELLVCSPFSVKFTKNNIDFLLLQCSCECLPIQTHENNENEMVLTESNNEFFIVELDATRNLNVVKNHAKHIFPIEGDQFHANQWISIEFPRNYKVVIESYGLTKQGHKIKVAKDQGVNQVPNSDCFIINPLDLLEEKMRLRALKMSKSHKKELNFSQNKKLNIIGNDSNNKSLINSCSMNLSASVANILNRNQHQIKKSIKKTNISLALCDRTNFDLKGVEFKKSIEKVKERSASGRLKSDASEMKKKMKYQPFSKNPKQLKYKVQEKQVNKSKNFMNSSKSSLMIKSQRIKSQFPNDYSSSSYYTSKKSVSSVFEQVQDFDGAGQQHSRVVKASGPRTETKRCEKVLSKGNFNLSTNPKSFSKNISQSKIMQVSRTLLMERNKK